MNSLEFKVPIEKKSEFISRFFNFISNQVSRIAFDNQKWPDSIKFTGPIGKELINIIKEKEWDFNRFNPVHVSGPTNKIIIEYLKPITQTSDTGATIDSSLNGKIIKGIPGPDTASKIVSYSSANTAFKIERTLRPSIHILLKRLK